METTDNELPPLSEYVGPDEMQELVKAAFPTKDSLKWFIRQNKEPLSASGALIFIGGRHRFHPDRFQRTAVQIARGAVMRCDR